MSPLRKVILSTAALLVAAACVLVIVGLWVGMLVGVAAVVTAGAAVWPLMAPAPQAPPMPELRVADWVVERPVELSRVATALSARPGRTVGITTSLHGAGGFGKTTLARMICTDRRIRRRFGGRVYWVTIGRDVRDAAALAAKVNDVIRLVAGEDAGFVDPQLAGQRLSAHLDAGPRKLLILDDVWDEEQLAPFIDGGERCARLITTRVPALLAGRGLPVLVDQMSEGQARTLLMHGIPPVDVTVADQLLEATGRWPLLLRLANKILTQAVKAGQDVSVAGTMLAGQLRLSGPAAADDLLFAEGLDVGQPEQRARAVRATIEASTGLLNQHDVSRFAELAVFAEDEAIPFKLVAWLWRTSAGLTELQASQVCYRLADLGLIMLQTASTGGSTLFLHDVMRDFLRGDLSPGRLAALHETLLQATATEMCGTGLTKLAGTHVPAIAWWNAVRASRYLSAHLVEHMIAAGWSGGADRTACDLRWVEARLTEFGPAAPIADLRLVGTPRADRLSETLSQAAHLLARTDPGEAVIDVLRSRVSENPDWCAQVAALRDQSRRPRLVNRWPMPDLPNAAFRHALTIRDRQVRSLVIAPDGTWLAVGGDHGTVQIWDTASWAETAVFPSRQAAVFAMAVSPDGTTLVTGGLWGTVRIWDTRNWSAKATLTSHKDSVFAAVFAPDGSWLVTGDSGGTRRVWDTATWSQQASITSRNRGSNTAIAPDGTWLATAGYGTMQIWDTATWSQKALLKGMGAINEIAIAPAGTWLATVGWDVARIWDTGTWSLKAQFPRRSSDAVTTAIAPDSTWLATGTSSGTVRIWDADRRVQRAVLTGHRDNVGDIAIAPDGRWLATGSDDGTVRIWDTPGPDLEPLPATDHHRVFALAAAADGTWLAAGGWAISIWNPATGTRKLLRTDDYPSANALAAAPDGTWLAAGDLDGAVSIWDTATWTATVAFTAHEGHVGNMAVAPDGRWLATSSSRDRRVRIWDTATWTLITAFRPHHHVLAMAIAPGGEWLVTGGIDEKLKIWSASWARRPARALCSYYDSYHAVAVAPDGSWLAGSGDKGAVQIWSTATWTETVNLTGHRNRVSAMAIASDGALLATSDADGTVRIWDTTSWRVQAMIRVDNAISACSWISARAIALGANAGIYIFDFSTGATALSPIRIPNNAMAQAHK